ncbi:MAG: cbb3-type cytochrome c oxidase subunit I [Candidatus Eisenbacteria bacterium]|nr:cbb3-type cytochrome c oxidase subunit I [Candidatus Eisenbacteria bacterium]
MNPRAKAGYNFFVFSAAVLLLQTFVFGLISAAQYVWPGFLFNILSFNMVRVFHINCLVFSLLAGFMGSTYYLLAEEGGRLHSEGIAKLNFWLLVLAVGLVLLGYLYMGLSHHYSSLFSEGREYIEAPRWADWAIVIITLLFLYNVFMTIKRRIGWNGITGILMLGLGGLAFFYLFGMKYFKNMTNDFFFWWWVIHLWVEGVWELIAAALYALLLVRLFGFPRERAIKYLYVEAGLVLFTGILGTGHHYYWIGTPEYWLLIGGFFSALEPLPLLVMVLDAVRISTKEKRIEHPNKLVKYWVMGGVIMHFIGAGVCGFIQTLPQVNRWTHGTQLTAAHGHIAFFGAYSMLIIAVTYYAIPRIKFGTDDFNQRRGMWAFWIMLIGLLGMVLSLTGAAMVQVFMERIGGLSFMQVQDYMRIFYVLRFVFGAFMSIGVVVFFLDVARPKPKLLRV